MIIKILNLMEVGGEYPEPYTLLGPIKVPLVEAKVDSPASQYMLRPFNLPLVEVGREYPVK